jgi:hypothetical protein
MSPEELLVPVLVASIVVAVVLFAMTFFRRETPADPVPQGQTSEAPDPPEEEGDGWYFVRHQPSEPPADLSLP